MKITKSNVKKIGRPKGSKNSISGIKKRPKQEIPESFYKAQFQKGPASAGPGRPPGSRNKLTLALEQIGMESAETVFKKLIDLSLGRTKEGDAKACKSVLDIVLSLRRTPTISLRFAGPLDTLHDINILSKHIIKMMVDGEISPEEAEGFGKILEQRMKIITDTEVMSKIESTCQRVAEIKNGR